MAALTTSNIILPKEVAKGIIAKVRDTSTIQALSAATPRLFKDVEHMTFSTEPEAEFVGVIIGPKLFGFLSCRVIFLLR